MLRAGIFVAGDVCPHCSMPTQPACACGPHDPRGSRSFLAQV